MKHPVTRNQRANKKPGLPVSRLTKAPAASRAPRSLAPSRQAAPMSAWFRSMPLSTSTVTIVIMVLIGGLMLSQQVGIWFTQRQQIADLSAQVAQAKLDLENMRIERKRWEDPVYIRSQARDRLYYVMPGEVSYLVMDADGVDLSDTSGTVGAELAKKRNITNITTDLLSTKKKWVGGIVQSFLRAGVEEPVQDATK